MSTFEMLASWHYQRFFFHISVCEQVIVGLLHSWLVLYVALKAGNDEHRMLRITAAQRVAVCSRLADVSNASEENWTERCRWTACLCLLEKARLLRHH